MSRFARVRLLLVAAAALAICAGPARAGLIGYWNMDGTVGTNATTVSDSGTHGNTGAAQGTVPYVAGKFGSATSYNGSALNYVNVPDNPDGSMSANWSSYMISMWINTTTSNTYGEIAKVTGTLGSQTGFVKGWNWHSSLQGYGDWGLGSSGTYNDGAWHNLVVRWDGPRTFRAYLDGAEVSNNDTAVDCSFLNNNVALTIGRMSSSLAFTGALDDVAILARTSGGITAAEAESISNVGNSSLGYSMADMSKLLGLYEAGSGTTTTSDGKQWQYATGLAGTRGTLDGSAGSYYMILSDAGGGGVQQTIPEPSALVLLATGLIGLLCYAWRRRK